MLAVGRKGPPDLPAPESEVSPPQRVAATGGLRESWCLTHRRDVGGIKEGGAWAVVCVFIGVDGSRDGTVLFAGRVFRRTHGHNLSRMSTVLRKGAHICEIRPALLM